MKDLIDRQTVIDIIEGHSGEYEYIEMPVERLLDDIRQLPSQTPEKRQGRDAKGALVVGDWHIEVASADLDNDCDWGYCLSVDIYGMDYRGGFFRQKLFAHKERHTWP